MIWTGLSWVKIVSIGGINISTVETSVDIAQLHLLCTGSVHKVVGLFIKTQFTVPHTFMKYYPFRNSLWLH